MRDGAKVERLIQAAFFKASPGMSFGFDDGTTGATGAPVKLFDVFAAFALGRCRM
jgi:hypothetical protein